MRRKATGRPPADDATAASRLPPPVSPPGSLLVARVGRPHGLSGELTVETRTEFPERLAAGALLRWSRGQDARELRIRSARPHGRHLLLSFEGVETIDSARELTGGELTTDRERLPPAPQDFLYSHEVEGWTCEDPSGRLLGRASELERTVAGPMLAIATVSGREALVPFVWPIVVAVDRPGRRIVIDPPEGLLEL